MHQGGVLVEHGTRIAHRPAHGLDAGGRDLGCLQLVQARLGARKPHPAQRVEKVVQVVARRAPGRFRR
jgi:hypothetical protein